LTAACQFGDKAAAPASAQPSTSTSPSDAVDFPTPPALALPSRSPRPPVWGARLVCSEVPFPISALHDNNITSCWYIARNGYDAERYLIDGHDDKDRSTGLLTILDLDRPFRQVRVPGHHGPVRITRVDHDRVCLLSRDGARATYDVARKSFAAADASCPRQ
jgi:hypothetical protein